MQGSWGKDIYLSDFVTEGILSYGLHCLFMSNRGALKTNVFHV